mgnify:CR=1 FL=1
METSAMIKILRYRREREVVEEFGKENWQCIKSGFPDFLFYKNLPDGKVEGFFVEVKKRPSAYFCQHCLPELSLDPRQVEYYKVLKGMGFEVKIIYKD